MHEKIIERLTEHGIQPSAQRVAIADYVFRTDSHPSADDVWTAVKKRLPVVSRATVYNTLNLLVERGLLRELFIAEGKVVFDPNTETHHHFIDDETGRIEDVPWDRVQVCNMESLSEFDITDYQVVMRGTRVASDR